MSLQDILGRTAETRILDLFIENFGNSYTQWEIYELTGISRNVLYKRLPEMVKNDLLEISGQIGNHRTYRLAKNQAVKKLTVFMWEYNSMESQKSDEEDLKVISPEPIVKTQNRYFKDPDIVPDDVQEAVDQIKKWIPVSSQIKKWLPLEYGKEATEHPHIELIEEESKEEIKPTDRKSVV